jgi:hypothetical protein
MDLKDYGSSAEYKNNYLVSNQPRKHSVNV